MKNIFFIILFTITIFSQWQKVSNDSIINGTSWTLISNQNKLFAAGYNLYYSSDEGKTWQDVIPPGYFNGYVNIIIADSNRLYVGTGGGFHFSTDNGVTWSRSGTFTENIRYLASINNYVFASTFASSSVYRSTDYGINWSPVPPLPNIGNAGISYLYSAFGKLFVGTNIGIYISSDFGNTWKQITDDLLLGINGFIAEKENIFALGNRVLISTDQGDSWQSLPNSPFPPLSCTIKDSAIFVTSTEGIYETIDNGNTWKGINEGLPEEKICYALVTDTHLIIGMQLNGIWIRPLSELTNVKSRNELNNIIFSLSQNYPNPFNSSTTIKFILPKPDNVELKIYNLVGQEISTLISKYLFEGEHQIQWDASNLPSGIYLYKLKTSYYTSTKKIILLK